MCLYIVGFSKDKKAALRAPGNGCSDEQATNGSSPAGDMCGQSAEEEGGEDGVPPTPCFSLSGRGLWGSESAGGRVGSSSAESC